MLEDEKVMSEAAAVHLEVEMGHDVLDLLARHVSVAGAGVCLGLQTRQLRIIADKAIYPACCLLAGRQITTRALRQSIERLIFSACCLLADNTPRTSQFWMNAWVRSWGQLASAHHRQQQRRR